MVTQPAAAVLLLRITHNFFYFNSEPSNSNDGLYRPPLTTSVHLALEVFYYCQRKSNFSASEKAHTDNYSYKSLFALPFSRTDKIRIFADTIRLSADSLIVPVDRIRKSADRIRKPTGRQNHFSSTKSPKIHKKASFSKKSSRFQFLWNKKTAISINIFQHLRPRTDFLLSHLNALLSIFPNNYPKPKQEATEHSPSWGRWRGLPHLLTASPLKISRRKEVQQYAYGCGEECARVRREDFGDCQSEHN